VSKIVTRYWAFNGLMSCAALLLPWAAVPESRVETAAANAALQATAHVNFRIVIPQVLYLHVSADAAPADTVAIMSNSRNVWLTATVRSSDDRMVARPPAVANAGRGDVILSAAGGKVIAQNILCAAGETRPARGGASHIICTVSMP
jgi:hypothetical protein